MKLSLFLVVLLGVAICSVHSHCVRKDSLEGMAKDILPSNITMDSEESDESGVKKFFKKLGCDIVEAGHKVKDGVKSGYEYVKDKLTPNKDKVEIADVVSIPNPEGKQEIFDIDVRTGIN